MDVKWMLWGQGKNKSCRKLQKIAFLSSCPSATLYYSWLVWGHVGHSECAKLVEFME